MLPKNMKDVYFEVNRKHDPTFGLLDEKGQPTETVMTNKSDYGTKKCIDYIFSNIKPLSACLRYFSEENFYNRKKW